MEGADFRKARIVGADLRWALMEGTDLGGVPLDINVII
ncbi:pentapeptide repeat-containing protein [Roseovarius sp. TM1035]